jgi:hypothetical protein
MSFSTAVRVVAVRLKLAAERVLSDGETDDPYEIERRTDEAFSAITNIDLRGN